MFLVPLLNFFFLPDLATIAQEHDRAVDPGQRFGVTSNPAGGQKIYIDFKCNWWKIYQDVYHILMSNATGGQRLLSKNLEQESEN